MKTKRFTLLSAFLAVIFVFNSMGFVFATEINETNVELEASTENIENIEIDELGLTAESAILMEKTTGKVLYEKNAHKPMYPASMTKILTAIMATEYLDMDKLYTAGYEINEIPLDSSKAGHKVGESITGYNLVRGLIIPSGNETANIVAKQVALIHENRENMEYNQAEEIFMELMNEKAREIGAVESNFVTPHGYHDDNHYTTAYDMALITRYAMDDEVISEIAKEQSFVGNGAGENPQEGLITNEYQWYTHNYLIKEGSPYYYPYATGFKTGFTDQAGYCVSATAEKDGVELIAIVMNSGDNERWEDAKKLFEYGYENYTMYDLQEEGKIIDSVSIESPQLGESDKLDVKTNKQVQQYLTNDEINSIFYRITYNSEFLSSEVNEDGQIKLKAPIEEGMEIGQIKYYTQVNGEELIYEDSIVSTRDVYVRTFKSDVDYYIKQAKDIIFSWRIIPISIVIGLIIFIIMRIIGNRRRTFRRRRKKYTFKTKY